MKASERFVFTVKFLLSTAALLTALVLWMHGFLNSPLLNPQRSMETRFLNNYLEANKPDLKEVRILAESYWLRYQDIREDQYWGEKGPMGIWGPRDHYHLFGKNEGRIYQPVHKPDNIERERGLAEAYWQRYPDIARSSIWGTQSSLGLLGPRDHYLYVGSREGRLWGKKKRGR